MNWIVVVDDDKSNLITAGRILSEHDMRVTALRSGKALLDFVSGNKPDLILLDVMMPDINGFDTAVILKKDPETLDIPIIFLTALNNPSDLVKGFQVGANDFLSKPIILSKLTHSIATQLNIPLE